MEKTLAVYLPYPKATIAQRFGANANPLYASQGLQGHTAYDWGVPWGTEIPNCVANAYCYSLMHVDDPVLMDYRAAFFIVETQTGVYEVSYGHLSEASAEVGKTYQVGDIIGKVGNTGACYVGQHLVTEAEKRAGSHAGAHLHGPQIRILAKTQFSNKYDRYVTLADGSKFVDRAGYFYGIPGYNNGYNGCVSLAKFSTERLAVKAPEAPQDPVLPPEMTVVDATVPYDQAVKTAKAWNTGPILTLILDILRGRYRPK
jgi:hypothetical protein